jgi:hypothetical protein
MNNSPRSGDTSGLHTGGVELFMMLPDDLAKSIFELVRNSNEDLFVRLEDGTISSDLKPYEWGDFLDWQGTDSLFFAALVCKPFRDIVYSISPRVLSGTFDSHQNPHMYEPDRKFRFLTLPSHICMSRKRIRFIGDMTQTSKPWWCRHFTPLRCLAKHGPLRVFKRFVKKAVRRGEWMDVNFKNAVRGNRFETVEYIVGIVGTTCESLYDTIHSTDLQLPQQLEMARYLYNMNLFIGVLEVTIEGRQEPSFYTDNTEIDIKSDIEQCLNNRDFDMTDIALVNGVLLPFLWDTSNFRLMHGSVELLEGHDMEDPPFLVKLTVTPDRAVEERRLRYLKDNSEDPSEVAHGSPQPIVQTAAAVLIAGNLPGADATGCEGSCPIFMVIAVMAVLSTLCVLWYRCSCVCYYRKRAKVQANNQCTDVVIDVCETEDEDNFSLNLCSRMRGGQSDENVASIGMGSTIHEEPLKDYGDFDTRHGWRISNREKHLSSDYTLAMKDDDLIERILDEMVTAVHNTVNLDVARLMHKLHTEGPEHPALRFLKTATASRAEQLYGGGIMTLKPIQLINKTDYWDDHRNDHPKIYIANTAAAREAMRSTMCDGSVNGLVVRIIDKNQSRYQDKLSLPKNVQMCTWESEKITRSQKDHYEEFFMYPCDFVTWNSFLNYEGPLDLDSQFSWVLVYCDHGGMYASVLVMVWLVACCGYRREEALDFIRARREEAALYFPHSEWTSLEDDCNSNDKWHKYWNTDIEKWHKHYDRDIDKIRNTMISTERPLDSYVNDARGAHAELVVKYMERQRRIRERKEQQIVDAEKKKIGHRLIKAIRKQEEKKRAACLIQCFWRFQVHKRNEVFNVVDELVEQVILTARQNSDIRTAIPKSETRNTKPETQKSPPGKASSAAPPRKKPRNASTEKVCVSHGDDKLWDGVDGSCLQTPADKGAIYTKWPKNYREIQLLERVQQRDANLLRTKNEGQCPLDQTYLKSSARCVNVKKVNKQLPADGPALTDGMLCPNCYQRRIERWVGGL